MSVVFSSDSTCSYLAKAVKLTTAKSNYEVSREAYATP
jgi:hypothetical protein